MAGTAWEEDAACRGIDTELFYIDRSTSHERVCSTCPVRSDCLAAGLHEEFGVWGGTTPPQRRRIIARARAGQLDLEKMLSQMRA